MAVPLTVKCSKQFGVPSERETLSDFLRRVISEKNLRYRQVAERSGGLISHAAISDIISGKTRNIKSSTISALAKGLDIPEAEIFAIVRGKPLSAAEHASEEKEQLWEMYADIPRQCQKDVMDFLRVLQRNHSVSARKSRQAGRRATIANMARVADSLPDSASANYASEKRARGEEPILPARDKRTA